MIYLKHVERQAQQQTKEEMTTRYSAPVFSTPLKDVTVNEGERSHFEAKVGPVGDPSMTVEWYCNGNLISASKYSSKNRIKKKEQIVTFLSKAPGSTLLASLALCRWTC